MKRIIYLLLLLPVFGIGQVAMSTSGSYSQDFNSLANTGTNIPWTDNTTIANWYCQKSAAGAVVYDASTGSLNAGKAYSFGATSDIERSLGTIGSSGSGNFATGIQLQNTSGGTINTLNVSYTMEQWRDGGNATPAAQQLRVFYQISSSAITSLTPGINTGWIEVPALMTSSPIYTTTAGALNGNDPLNKVTLTNIAIPGLTLTNGQFIMIKWEDPNHTGNDHGLSIDDVTISWTISCNTTATINPTVCNSYTVPSGDETYNTSGIYMDTIPNAALCDSILTINLTITTGITYYADTDSDGFGNPLATTVACSLPVGYVTNSNDCDDSNNAIGVATTTFYQDADGDTFGSATSTMITCSQPVGYVTNNLDCNDSNNAIHPNATDIPDNGIDEDCSGADASSLGSDIGMYEFTQAAACPVTALDVTTQPLNAVFSPYSTMNTSCQSTANVFNNSDWNTTAILDLNEYNEFSVNANDCYTIDINRIIFTHKNSASGGFPTWTLRSSLDNFATDVASGLSSSFDKIDTINLSSAYDAIDQVTFRFYVTNISATTATWRNDNVRVIGTFGTLTPQTYYADADGDTYGDPSSTLSACTPPVGYVSNNSDCNDNNATINPATIWYQDLDNDTYGNVAVTITNCIQPNGYVAIAGDCDDLNNAVYQTTTYYVDLDADGHGDASAIGTPFCTNPGAGYSVLNDDCDDTDNAVYPGATEICDGKDNDCMNGIDDGLTFVDYYVDTDNDTYGIGSPVSLCSNPGVGYATQDGDCDDNSAAVYPGATEILDNGIDENCDGTDNYLGLSEENVYQFSIHPNPSNGLITFSMNQEVNGMIEVVDLNGKVQFSQELIGSETHLNLSDLAKGTYLLKLKAESIVLQKRIVLQ